MSPPLHLCVAPFAAIEQSLLPPCTHVVASSAPPLLCGQLGAPPTLTPIMAVGVQDLQTARMNASKAAAFLESTPVATEGNGGSSTSPRPSSAVPTRTTLAALLPDAPAEVVAPHVAAAADVLVDVHYNLTLPEVQDHELRSGEAVRAANGAMVVRTGAYTGRSPKDRFIVDRGPGWFGEHIDWGEVNQPISPSHNDELFRLVAAGLEGKRLYVFDGYVGASLVTGKRVRVITADAYLHHFCLNMLLPPMALGQPQPALDTFNPEYTVLSASCVTDEAGWRQHGLHSSAFITFDFDRHLTLIGGTKYSGEIKKGLFAVQNALLPRKDRLSMHCAATTNENGTDSVLFFGLSGTCGHGGWRRCGRRRLLLWLSLCVSLTGELLWSGVEARLR